MPISVKAAIDVDGRIPLLRNEREEWGPPSGKLEVGEHLEDNRPPRSRGRARARRPDLRVPDHRFNVPVGKPPASAVGEEPRRRAQDHHIPIAAVLRSASPAGRPSARRLPGARFPLPSGSDQAAVVVVSATAGRAVVPFFFDGARPAAAFVFTAAFTTRSSRPVISAAFATLTPSATIAAS